jgi:hypothetical protein
MDNVLPPFTDDTPLNEVSHGFSGSQKREIYKTRGRIDEVSRERYPKGFSHIHHMYPKSQGGPEIRRNAAVLGHDTHEKLHSYCWELTKKEMPGEPTMSSDFRQRWAHNVYWQSYELREATRESLIIQGMDPRYVYQEDYLFDKEVKRRIDIILEKES